ncbi:bifunctional metallophosphatase/5'-nucleotidase [Vagococcus entomophilus]|uniref:Multifunctional 2',3'-cyclic-nucleotide 2'-phosphodiesterase/5'-nucleotidase/3'-nucleotidase n=1 Tax=Vagococcus entomophilus TaxID=1160095 RepID=A0A430AHJ2_9ENTE|nr:metallophosphoesterase [Vagococcus entomophilus]RSU07385.1 multifunctional 2',3'-cyclic-nucleotide 2'-phosphodiesterase/5'-nucleotidase/3'-nucleotidase [Vagococcus entomophilus]
MEKIVLLHTNDLHSHFEHWPKIRRFLAQRKKRLEQEGATVFQLDLGDFVDRSHPLTESTNGQFNIQLMNQVEYDAVTIGNNEGIGNSRKELNDLYNQADFPVVLGNIYDEKTNQLPKWATPYKILESSKGFKLAVLGLTAPFPLTYHPNGWSALSPDEVLPDLIRMVEKKADAIVLLSHLGIQEDRRLAERFPEIDVIIGAHTHHLLPDGEQVHETLLAAAGKYGYYVGEITLRIEATHLLGKEATVHPTSEMFEQQKDADEIQSYLEQGYQQLKGQRIARIPHSLAQSWEEANPLIEIALKAIEAYASTTSAMLNSGLFLASLPKGIVTANQLHQILPHPMHLIRVTLSGADLVRLFQEITKNQGFLKNYPILGMGFRGEVFGTVVFDGMSYERHSKKGYYAGKPIIATKRYTFVTVDHFLFIPFFPTIEIAGEIEMVYPDFLRRVTAKYLEKHYPLKIKKDIID